MKFEIEKESLGNIIYEKDNFPNELRNVLANIDKKLYEGTILKNSRTTCAAIVSLPSGKKVFIKRYNNKGIIYSLKYFFRKSRAFNSFVKGHKLREIGILTPHPYAALSVRQYGILKASYLICEVMENIVPTIEFFKFITDDSDRETEFFSKIVDLMLSMHNHGIIHNDFKLSNIFVKKNSELYSSEGSKNREFFEYGIWDIDSLRIYSSPLPQKKREKDVNRFIKSYCELANRLNIEYDEDIIKKIVFEKYKTGLTKSDKFC